MTTGILATAARAAIAARMGPALEAFEANARQLRRTVIRGRHRAEDLAAAAALQVRRHPLGAVAGAVCTGLMVGALAGFFAGRNGRART